MVKLRATPIVAVMKPIKSVRVAWFVVIAGGLLLALGLVNIVLNFDRPATYLALIIVMIPTVWIGISSLRRLKMNRRRTSE